MSTVLPSAVPVKIVSGYKPGGLDATILEANQPVVLKGFGDDWPIVQAGKQSGQQAFRYLQKFCVSAPIATNYAEPSSKGRIFYNDDMSGFNFVAKRQPLAEFLEQLLANVDNPEPPTLYIPSTDVDQWFPGLALENNAGLDHLRPIKLLWAGNRSRIAAHYDSPNNIACCVAGRRRFTLFPPEQVVNLYPGPMEFAPGGQEISLIDFAEPDLQRFPKFEQAMAAAQVAELEPGDALFLPGMWWHHVEGLDAINVLYTHWWREAPAYSGRSANALLLAILSLRNLPEDQRKAWRNLFDYYVFDREESDVQCIPENVRGMLRLPMSELDARKLRAELIKKLNI